jgi:hypothetical protein
MNARRLDRLDIASSVRDHALFLCATLRAAIPPLRRAHLSEVTMVTLTSLWLPILVSAILVFVVSSIIHMVIGYHVNDWKKLPSQADIQDALRRFAIPPGDYSLPGMASAKEMNSEEFKTMAEKGPMMVMTLWPGGEQRMGKSLALWFLYSALVALFAGYVAVIVLGTGAPYLTVFRVTGTVAFAGYSLALLQQSIWYHRNWITTFRSMFDGLVYALLTAGSFGWLWPEA